MRTIIAGTRTIQPKEAETLVLKALKASGWHKDITKILHGGCRGVDEAAGSVLQRFYPIEVYPADWNTYGNAAGPIRNRKMAENADALIAIWDFKSRGTGGMIKIAKDLGLQVFIYDTRK